MFPIQDAQGRVVAFGGRLLDKGEPKYLNSPETPLFRRESFCTAISSQGKGKRGTPHYCRGVYGCHLSLSSWI